MSKKCWTVTNHYRGGGNKRAENKSCRGSLVSVGAALQDGWYFNWCVDSKKEEHAWNIQNCPKQKKICVFPSKCKAEAYLMRTNGRRRVERLLRCLARALQEKHIMRGMFSRHLPANLQRHKSQLISPLPPLAFFATYFEGAKRAAITEWLCAARYNPRPRLLLAVMF